VFGTFVSWSHDQRLPVTESVDRRLRRWLLPDDRAKGSGNARSTPEEQRAPVAVRDIGVKCSRRRALYSDPSPSLSHIDRSCRTQFGAFESGVVKILWRIYFRLRGLH
jgi:hypothetical protein